MGAGCHGRDGYVRGVARQRRRRGPAVCELRTFPLRRKVRNSQTEPGYPASTDSTLPAGSRNQAMSGPLPFITPRSSAGIDEP